MRTPASRSIAACARDDGVPVVIKALRAEAPARARSSGCAASMRSDASWTAAYRAQALRAGDARGAAAADRRGLRRPAARALARRAPQSRPLSRPSPSSWPPRLPTSTGRASSTRTSNRRTSCSIRRTGALKLTGFGIAAPLAHVAAATGQREPDRRLAGLHGARADRAHEPRRSIIAATSTRSA